MVKNRKDTSWNESYCSAAFNHIYATSNAHYKLCCHAGYFKQENPRLHDMKTDNTLPFDYFLSPEMDKIRKQMLNNEIVSECHRCNQADELVPYSSPRYNIYNSTKRKLSKVDGVTIKLRIFGSSCNLGCYMCFPQNSSTRRKEIKEAKIDWRKLNSKGEMYEGQYREDVNIMGLNIKFVRWNELKKHLLQNMNYISKIKITGGEPFLMPRTYEFLKDIPDAYAKKLFISFDTNLTTTKYKNKYSLEKDILPKFVKPSSGTSQVSLSVSADHFGKKLSWIRYPIDVSSFEVNLFKYKKYISSIKCTVSILNVYDLKEIEEYYMNEFGLSVDFNCVDRPQMLSIKNIKNKNIWIPNKKSIGYIRSRLAEDSSEDHIDKMRHYIKSLEQHRNFSLKDAGWNDEDLYNIGYLK